jgi:hypothetical protein
LQFKKQKGTFVFEIVLKEEHDVGSYKSQHVALCDKTLKWCWTAYFYLFVYEWLLSSYGELWCEEIVSYLVS